MHLLKLPDELLISIAEQLKTKDVARLSRVNGKLHEIANDCLYKRDGTKALRWGAWQGSEAPVEVALSYGTDIDTTDRRGGTALMIATSRTGNTSMVRFLLEHGASTSLICDLASGTTAMSTAIIANSDADVELLLDHGADPNIVDLQGRVPLHYATLYDRLGMIQLLIRRGANTKAYDHSGASSLNFAVKHCPLGTVRWMLENGFASTINGKDYPSTAVTNTPVMDAIQKHNADLVKLLLDHGADPSVIHDAPNELENGHSPFSLAALRCRHEISSLLVAAGADIWYIGQDGHPVICDLINADFDKYFPQISLDDANVKRIWDSLFHGCSISHYWTVEWCLDHGVDANQRCSCGCDRTALSIARNGGYRESVELLLKRGADH